MGDSETFDLPEDPWDELLHQGDVFEESVRATPDIVRALRRGTDDDETWLYVLAAMCVGRPASRAERIRSHARKGADVYRTFLRSEDARLRAAAIGVLCAADAAEARDRDVFAKLAREERSVEVRTVAILGLGLEPGFEAALEEFLGEEPAVRYAAASALRRLGHSDDDVIQALVDAIGTQAADDVTGLPPWDHLYAEAFFAAKTKAAVPFLLEQLSVERDPVSAVDLAELALGLAGAREDVVRLIVESDAVWDRAAQLERPLKERGLPTTRNDLRAWLEG